jgi:hypothetical protein
MNGLFLLALSLFSVNVYAANAVIICKTTTEGWSFEFDGAHKKIEYLAVHDSSGKSWIFYPTSSNVFRGDRYLYDGSQLVISPDPSDFPKGLVLVATECEA